MSLENAASRGGWRGGQWIDAHQQAQLNGIRTLLEHRANTGTHCPALFSIRRTDRTGLRHPAKITVTLWREWPFSPHPLTGKNGSYTVTTMPDALIRYVPYLHRLITTLGLGAPVLGAAGIALSDQVKARIETASRTLEFIAKHTEAAALVPTHDASSSSGRSIRAETGADFRALRAMLETLDSGNEMNWGGLSPVSRPEDRRTIYLCPHHIDKLDYPYTQTRLSSGQQPLMHPPAFPLPMRPEPRR